MTSLNRLTAGKASSGLSLIELMVALAVSAILLLGVATVYTASKRSYQVNSEIAELQENARFALHTLTRELRMAGYTGCTNVNSITLNILSKKIPPGYAPPGSNDPNAIIQGDFGQNNYIAGYTFDSSGSPSPAFSDANLMPNNVVPDTDAVLVRKADACSATLLSNNTSSSNVQVQGNCGFKKDEPVIITNCQTADMFTVTNIPTNNGNGKVTLAYASNNNRQNKLTNTYTPQNRSRVLKANTLLYYIGTDANNNNVPTLYVLRLEKGQATQQPLIPNVANMRVRYSLDIDGDPFRSIDPGVTKLTAQQVGALTSTNFATAISKGDADPSDSPWSRVTRVDIRLLLQSKEVGTSSKSYSFDGVNYDGVDQALPQDNRYRREFVSAINLRNRTP